ncbi:hypothetical protein [Rivibacter subsaxonicus]|uniref:Uncharacterized protein n=1 Tax=Rivibacter subsaxonicus TaxID=457575 RepID=A0A4Q7VZ12_9BURK|nr:hypothetical protein [Rivibacter subsaxonicus]RZU02041.1 hypothetical protein EV670_0059 [Rivibacter subsaxonicus]
MFNRLLSKLVPALVLAAAATLPAHAQRALPSQDFDVYVDLPTGFAFIKTPIGWKFIRKLDVAQLKKLHPMTLTTLLEPSPADALGSPRLARLESRADAIRAGGED